MDVRNPISDIERFKTRLNNKWDNIAIQKKRRSKPWRASTVNYNFVFVVHRLTKFFSAKIFPEHLNWKIISSKYDLSWNIDIKMFGIFSWCIYKLNTILSQPIMILGSSTSQSTSKSCFSSFFVPRNMIFIHA